MLAGVAGTASKSQAAEQTVFGASVELVTLKASSDFGSDGPAVRVIPASACVSDGNLTRKSPPGAGKLVFTNSNSEASC